MSFTALHQALGRGPGPFLFEMLDEAINSRIEESTNLDWKEALPHKSQKEAFAKDVAAMANSGGGVIVYGVGEVDDLSAAAGSTPGVTGWGDAEERRLRQIAYSGIQPPVQGLKFEVARRGDVVLVAMSVPSSPEAPHLVRQNSGFEAPIRYGAQTEFMQERELAQAYSRRFTARNAFQQVIEDRARHVLAGLDLQERVWLVGAAVPASPRPSHLPRVSRGAAQQIALDFLKASPFAVGSAGAPSMDVNPMSGLRRWRFFDRVGGVVEKIVEVHDDGGVTFAQAVETKNSSLYDKMDLHPMQGQHFVCNFIWLSVVAARALQVDNSYALRLTIEWEFPGPVHIRRFQDGLLADRSHDTAIHRFIPVEVNVEPRQSDEALLGVVRDVATDVMSQGGTWNIGTSYIRATPSGEV